MIFPTQSRKMHFCVIIVILAKADNTGRSPTISFIKIDVQGAELMVLAGMQNTLQINNYPPILIEYSPCELQQSGCTQDEFFVAFSKLGYLPYDVISNTDIDLDRLLHLDKTAYSDIWWLS